MSATDLPPIKGFIKNTFIDWEGQIAAMLFLPHCNFRCSYCHARSLVVEPDTLPTVPISEVMEYLAENKGWIDGVVISGGEPTLHAGLEQLVLLLKSAGLKVKLDTNGTNPAVIQEFLARKLLDYIAMDIKAPLDAQRYNEVTVADCSLQDVRKSIDLIMDSEIEYEFRTTVCPEFLDKEDVADIASAIEGADKYVLQPFRPVDCLDPSMEDVEPYTREELWRMAEVARQFVPSCTVRGEEPDEDSPILDTA